MMKLVKTLIIGAVASISFLTTVTAQKCTSWEAYPKGKEEAKRKNVFYTKHMEKKEFNKAFEIWSELFAHVTAPAGAKELHFQDGIALHVEFLKVETDATKKKEHLNRIIELYDQKAACNGEKSIDRAYQAYYMQSYQGDVKQTLAVVDKSMELGKLETSYLVFSPAAVYAIYAYNNKMVSKEYVRNIYNQLKNITQHNIQKKNQAQYYQQYWDYVESVYKPYLTKIFDCKFFEDQNRPIFTANKSNPTIRVQILAALKKGLCKEDAPLYSEIMAVHQPYLDSLVEAKKDSIYASYPAWKKGNKKYKDHKDEAIAFYKTALEKGVIVEGPHPITKEALANIAYKVAYYYYQKSSFSNSRTYCRKASSLKPNWGEPYLLVGTLYASSGKRCDPSGKGTGFDAQVVVWAAMDEWQKARSVDPSCAAKANAKISQYRQYMPDSEALFLRSIKKGAPYKIGCWMGVTTTVR